ncbi:polymer-forming cytoskeletal protein [Halorubrum rubrum]|uniref:Polymer-forming cytoskeletal protein n=1 Tax=Halorubrum rubrum TaxID=1126240 RepID=A0ABD5R2W5_9EURY|nr:polymer-forming cytoskeletal protein [Halorubrum rubrum]
MSFSHDRRGQSVVVGAVVLFGFLILAMATYQVQFVPMENEEIEFEHSQQVEGEFLDLRNAILNVGSTGSVQSEPIQLGTRYPQRTFFLNPPPASGSLQTTNTDQIRIENVSVEEGGNAEAYWNDTDNDLTFNTSSLQYRPNYNEYRGAPRLIYEHSAVAAEFGGEEEALFRSNPTVLRDGTGEVNGTISIPILLGEFSANGVDPESVDLRSVSSGERTIALSANESSRIVLPTAVENETELADEWNRTTPAGVTARPGNGNISLEGIDGSYSLGLSAVTADDGGAEKPAYIVPVSGTTAVVGDSVGVEVRDKYNNPVAGAEVWFDGSKRVSGTDGRAFFESNSSDGLTVTINDSSNPLNYEKVLFTVTEAGGSGSVNRTFSTEWDPYPDPLTVVANNDRDLNVTVSDRSGSVSDRSGNPIANATIDYSIAPRSPNGSLTKLNQSVHDGADSVKFEAGSAKENESFDVYASAGDDVDTISVKVIDGSVAFRDEISENDTEFTVEHTLTNLGSGYLVIKNEDRDVNYTRTVSGVSSTIEVANVGGIRDDENINATLYESSNKETQLDSDDATVVGERGDGESTPITAFESTSASNLAANSDDQTQTLTFSVDGDLVEDEDGVVEIDLSNAQDGTGPPGSRGVQYGDATTTVIAGSGSATIEAGGPNAVVEYSAGAGDDPPDAEIQIAIEGVDVGDVVGDEYDIEFRHPDAGTEITTFGIAETSGDRRLNGNVDGDVYSTGSLTLANEADIDGDVDADGSVTLNYQSQVRGSVTSSDSVMIRNEAIVHQNIHSDGPVTLNFRSDVRGMITSRNSVTLENEAIVRDDIKADGPVILRYRSEVKGGVTSQNSVTLENEAVVDQNIEANGTVTLNYQSEVKGDVLVDSAGDISCDDATINGQSCTEYVAENY